MYNRNQFNRQRMHGVVNNQRAALVSRSEEVVRQAINQIQPKIGDNSKKS